MFEFEQKVLRQQCYWVAELRADALQSEITLVLVVNPENGEIEGTIRFAGIVWMKLNYHGEEIDPEYMPILMGIQDVAQEGGRRYTITTDTVEISCPLKIEPS